MVWVCSPHANIDKIRHAFSKKMKRALENKIIREEQLTSLLNIELIYM